MPKNAQKRPKKQNPKNYKNENWPILIPYDVNDNFWWQRMGQKHAQTARFGGAEWKLPKKRNLSKRARKFFLKIGKIHVIYVYIKNKKQTDKLPKSQVGCVLEEVCIGTHRKSR